MARVSSGLGQGVMERTASSLSEFTNEPRLTKEMHQVADYYLHQVSSPEIALQWYDSVLRLTPNVDGVLEGKANSLAMLGRNDEAYRVLCDVRTQPEYQGQRELWLARNRMRVARLDQAFIHFKRAMELGVPERDLARELMDVYRGLERWSDLYDVMTRRLSGLEGVERLEMARNLARLAWSELSDLDRAVEYWLYADELRWDYQWLQEGIECLPEPPRRRLVERFVDKAEPGTPNLSTHLASLIEGARTNERFELQLRLVRENSEDREVREAVIASLVDRGKPEMLIELLESFPQQSLEEKRVLISSHVAVNDLVRAQALLSMLNESSPASEDLELSASVLARLGRFEDSVQNALLAARLYKTPQDQERCFAFAISTLSRGDDASHLRFEVLAEQIDTLGIDETLLTELSESANTRSQWMRVIDLGERWFAEGRASSTFIRVLLSWAFEGLGTTTRALNVLRNALESDRLELAQAAGLLEGYLSDDMLT